MSEEEKPKSKERTQLTPKQWAEVCGLWELGSHTLADLSREYSTSVEHLSRELKRRGVVKGSKADVHAARIQEAMIRESEDSAKVLASRIKETKENHFKWNQVLGKLTMAEIVKAQNSGREFSDSQDNLRALKLAAETLNKLRGDTWSLLGLDKENVINDEELPTLHIIEKSDQEIREAQAKGEFGFDLETVPEFPDIDEELTELDDPMLEE